MGIQQAWRYFIADLNRYSHVLGRSRLGAFFFAQGAQAALVYRFGHWLFTDCNPRNPLVQIGRIFYFILFRLTEMFTGISLEAKAEIGPGLYIGHFGCIIVGSGVKLGANCNISQGVTLGVDGRGSKRGSPQVGDRVFIAPGAKVFGQITIGSDAVIGANAVVSRSVPERGVAVGIPAKVISYRGSFDFVTYIGMEHDADRNGSLALAEQNSPPIDIMNGESGQESEKKSE
jgi:serine O-acetyltransferase